MLTSNDRWPAGAAPGPVAAVSEKAEPPSGSTKARPLWVWGAVGTVGSIGLALFGTVVGATPHGAVWWFSLPPGHPTVSGLFFYLSVGLLVAGWAGIGVGARAGRLTTRRAWALLGAWGLPLMLGPPLFSRDLYSYMAQGVIAHSGLNPYAVGPSVLGPGPLLASVASVWRHAPAPYGPFFVTATRLVAALFGTSITAEVLALRVLEVAGVALIMLCLPRLARNLGADPGVALWLGVLSPLALFSFIASGHNDALMVGLLVAGLTLASEGKPSAALFVCALAMTVKVPAAAGVVFVGLGWLRSTRGRERRRAAALVVAVPVVTVVTVTWATGLPWTWLGPRALRVPTELRVLPTPSVAFGTLLSHLLALVGVHLSRAASITVTDGLLATVAVVAVVWLALHVRRFDEVRLVSAALVVVVLAGPTVWPWYLLWGLVLLAATVSQRSKALAVAAAAAMLVVGPGGSPVLLGNAYLVVVGACLAGAVWLLRDRRWATVALGHGV